MVRNWLPKSWRRFLSSKQPSRKPSRPTHHRPFLEVLEDRLVLSNIFTVTSTSDSGSGSLRAAITAANAASGPSTIDFNISGSGAQTINLLSALPIITNAVTIDGSSQTGFNGTPLIVLNGSGAGSGANGLVIDGGSSIVKDLAIDNFSGDGIELVTGGGDVLTGNYIGVDATGKTAAANGFGVYVLSANNTVGGTTTAALNVISGNNFGVAIAGSGASGNAVQGNYIGTDATGAAKMANTYGVVIAEGAANNTVGGTAAADLNVLSGNSYAGVEIQDSGSSGNVVEGNYVGTDNTGLVGLANSYGVVIYGSANNTVGAGNVLSGNLFGVALYESGASGNVVQGNYIGTDKTGAKALANTYGVYIANGSASNTVGGTVSGAANVLSGNSFGVVVSGSGSNVVEGNYIGTDLTGTKAAANAYGVFVYSAATNNIIGGTTTAALNVISGNTFGAFIDGSGSTGNVVEGNYIGTDVTGANALANTYGVYMADGAANNVVGGTTAAARNVISGNSYFGVQLASIGTSGNVMEGNYIGTDKTGLVGLGNGAYGVALIFGASGNVVGGTTATALNVIAGNTYDGVEIIGSGTSGNVVEGNYIGTDKSGAKAMANGYGVYIASGSANNTVGGTVSGAANVLSGNSFGVVVSGSSGNVVEGNYIGTDVTGTKAVANTYGVYVYSAAANNIIGGTTAAARNIISANSGGGVYLTGSGVSGNVVEGNYIGTDKTGTNALGNGDGMVIAGGAANNAVGGTTIGAGNVIAYSTNNGVQVDTGAGNAIRQNTIYNSGNLGIALTNNGNNNQAAPVLTTATTNGITITVNGSLSATANTSYALDFFANPSNVNEGQQYLGSATVTTNSNGIATFTEPFNVSVPVGDFVSATATDPGGDTSEFASNVQTNSNFFVVTTTSDSGAGSLRQAILSADAASSASFIDFSIGSGAQTINLASALPTITNAVIIEGATQPGFTGSPLIVLDGSGAGAGANGLTISAGNSIVEDLSITNFSGFGIDLQTGGGNVVTGTISSGNGIGVYIGSASNTIGGTATGAGNVISANANYGVYLSGDGNVVEGNYIGTDSTGTSAAGNGYGVFVGSANNTIGGTTTAARNVISANSTGVLFASNMAAGNVVQGNYIGTDKTGTANLGNGTGVLFTGPNNTVGGTTAGAGNVIAYSSTDGVEVFADTGDAIRENSIYGSGNLGIALVSNGNNNQVAPTLTLAATNGTNIVIQGTLSAAANTTYALDFFANQTANPSGAGEGQQYLGSATVTTNASGTASINQLFNVSVPAGYFVSATATDPGGDTSQFATDVKTSSTNLFVVTNNGDSGAGSLRQAILNADAASGSSLIVFNISGSGVQTISLQSALPTITNAVTIDGTSQPGFAGTPLIVLDGTNAGSSANGLTIAAGNSTVKDLAIDHFLSDGILLEKGGDDVLTGNYLGVDSTGKTGAGNFIGVEIESANNTIGGTAAGAGNVISSNTYGVVLDASGATGNVVEGNYVGTDVTGTKALGNNYGVFLTGEAASNTIGGTTTAARNVISASSLYGVTISTSGTTGNMVEGNYIGTDVSGTVNLGNNYGVYLLSGALNNSIGGTATGAGNVIAYSTNDGVYVSAATGDAIRGNSIHDSGNLGINLVSNGNNNQPAPVLASAVVNVTSIIITGSLTAAANTSYALDFFASPTANKSGAGEGQQYLGSATVTTNASGTVSFTETFMASLRVGYAVSATATDPGGNTSAFATDVTTYGFFQVTNTNDSGPGSLRQAIMDANTVLGSGSRFIDFDISGSGPQTISPLTALPVLFSSAIIDGSTQPGFAGTPLIVLDGSKAGNANGLTIAAGNSTVKDLAIDHFSGVGIQLGTSGFDVLTGNYIGVASDGTTAAGNGIGVDSVSPLNTIGGTTTAARNIISASTQDGILIPAGDGNVIEGNYIGTDKTGTAKLGNGHDGVFIEGSLNVTVGGTATGASNIIANSGYDGVEAYTELGAPATGDAIRENSIYNSGNLGIDLVNGANNNQAAPTLTSAISNGSSITIAGTLTAADNTAYALDFFASPTANKSGYGEGQQYLGTATVTTNASGTASFTETFNVPVPANYVVSATATDPGGNTSPFAKDVTVPNLFVVTNTNDSGTGSLRAAITATDGATGTSLIDFAISGSGAQTINLLSALPTITNTVTIDGSSQTGFAGRPLIVLNGSSAGSGANGLTITAGNSTVKDLVIDHFNGDGIDLQTGGDDVLTGNYIGTDSTGTLSEGNRYGVVIEDGSANNTVGGTTTAALNILSGNGIFGVYIIGSGATGNVLQGNYIGTNVAGASPLGNDSVGVYINAASNTVGGTTTAARNIISGNGGSGVEISGSGVTGNVVEGNYIGTDVSGTVKLSDYIGVAIQNAAANNTVGGTTTGAANVIAYNSNDGVQVNGATTTGNAIRGNSIHDSGHLGIELVSGGNNSQAAPVLTSAATNGTSILIQGTLTAAANTTYALDFFASPTDDLSGNAEGQQYFGSATVATDSTGKVSFTETFTASVTAGYIVSATATDPGGNTSPFATGVKVTPNLFIVTNTGDSGTGSLRAAITAANGATGLSFIDFDISGSGAQTINLASALPTITNATIINGASQPGFAGTPPIVLNGSGAGANANGLTIAAGNSTVEDLAIDDFTGYGIELETGGGDVLIGNYLGVASNGTTGAANGNGVEIESANNTVGGTTAAARNIISGNTGDGVYLTGSGASGNVVQGNYIGTDNTGTAKLGNSYGVYINGAASNTVGGTVSGAGNVIAYSTNDGVYVSAGTGNAIRQNSIHDSGNLGINLVSGANNNQAAPVLASAAINATSITITGTLTAADSTAYTLDFFASPTANKSGAGEGQLYLGSATVTTNASGTASINQTLNVSVPVGYAVSATATDPGGNTSAFAKDVTTFGLFEVSNTSDSGAGSLRQAIADANAVSGSGSRFIDFDISGSGAQTIRLLSALPTITNAVTIDGSSQTGFAGTPLIVLDGSKAGAGANGLVIAAGNSIVKDLAIDNFGGDGIGLTTSGFDVLTGNYVGVASDGKTGAGNNYGVFIASGSTNNTIGSTAAGAGNVISGNFQQGVHLDASGVTGNVVEGNYIGTDSTGATGVGNGTGVSILSANNTVGGTTAAARNVISANINGVLLTGSGAADNAVEGNYIGTDLTGTANLFNDYGVSINGAVNNTVGGTTTGAGNVIAYSGVYGVEVNTGTGNAIRENSIHDSVSLGIALVSGGNNNQAAPVLTSAATNGTNIAIQGTLSAAANTTYALDFFASPTLDSSGNAEGQQYLGSAAVTTNGSGTVTFTETFTASVPLGYVVSATATDPGGNTSAFATGVKAVNLFLVTNTGDSGTGSLREAIAEANAISGPGVIDFDIGGGGVQTISPASALPAIINPVIINGASQPGFSGTPLIVLNGSGAGSGANGLTITAGNSIVEDLAIDNFKGDGIELLTGGDDVLTGNYLGVASDGKTGAGNGYGVFIASGSANNTIGGTVSGAGNVISGNTTDGVEITGSGTSGNMVQGNYIGTEENGTTALGNSEDGVYINSANNMVGGTMTGAGNVIAYNGTDNVQVDTGTGNAIRGNSIHDSGNLGIELINGGNNSQAAPTLTSAATNGSSIAIQGALTAAANTSYTLDFFASPTANKSGAGEGQQYLGSATVTTDSTGKYNFTETITASVPVGYFISATATDPGGNTSTFATDVKTNANFFIVTSTNDPTTPSTGDGSLREAIAEANAATGSSFIEFDIPGSGAQTISLASALPTISKSVIIDGASQPGFTGTPPIVLDGTNAGSGANGLTIAAGNSFVEDLAIDQFGGDGIDLQTGGGNVLIGNYIGTDFTGTQALGNTYGVVIEDGSANNTVGGAAGGTGNVICDNPTGVYITSSGGTGNVVEGNYIGTEANGTTDLGDGYGVEIESANNTVGGTAAGSRNVISGNTAQGVYILTGSGNVVEGNYIGTDKTGTSRLGNGYIYGSYGVVISGSANNTIGGTTTAARNVISANTGGGVNVTGSGASGNVVQGNYIGTDYTGAANLGNGGDGVYIGSSNNAVGGTTTAAGNVIAYSSTVGVEVDATHGTATGNAIRENSIYNSGNYGIQLVSGGNNNQAAPTLTSAATNGSSIAIQGTLTAAANTTYTLDFFADKTANSSGYGEGQQYLGSATVTTDSTGKASFTETITASVPVGYAVSVTATDPGGNTSGFSEDVLVNS